MINIVRIEQASYIVSSLNNFLEREGEQRFIKGMDYDKDIVSEMGFGFCESDCDYIYCFDGDGVKEIKKISTNKLFMKIATNGVDWELIDWLWD